VKRGLWFLFIIATCVPLAGGFARAATPALTVERIVRDGLQVASAPDVTIGALDGSVLRQGVSEGEALPDDVRLTVPATERVRVGNDRGAVTVAGASVLFHYTGRFESVAMLAQGQTEIDDSSNAFLFFGPGIELTVRDGSCVVDIAGQRTTVTRTAGSVTAELLGFDAFVQRVDLLTNARPSIVYTVGEKTLVDVPLREDQAAASAGDAFGEFNLGMRFYWGSGVAANTAQAIQLLQAAAAQRFAEAENSIGYAYAYGPSGTQDLSKAADWLTRAAANGSGAADDTLGDMYNYGHGVTQSYAEAMRRYTLGAELGDADAENDIGLLYYSGHQNYFGNGTPDYASAMHWFRIAAAGGNADAENDVGYAYEYGHGVSQDYAQALAWFHLSAAQLDRAAENNLGIMYEYGRGVPKDDAQALYWYRLAAAQGLASAAQAVERIQGKAPP